MIFTARHEKYNFTFIPIDREKLFPNSFKEKAVEYCLLS